MIFGVAGTILHHEEHEELQDKSGTQEENA
jgi:hypothetical protein